MIANVKRPRDWSVADWGVVLTLLITFGAGAWQAASANAKLEALMEMRPQVQDHEKRITKLEFGRQNSQDN